MGGSHAFHFLLMLATEMPLPFVTLSCIKNRGSSSECGQNMVIIVDTSQEPHTIYTAVNFEFH
jgi:hypothetical protein